MADYTPYQRKIIQRYYSQRDRIMLTKLSEIVTELGIADTEARCDRLWKRAAQAMRSLKIPPKLAERILDERKPEMLARNVKVWLIESDRSKDGG